MATRRSSDSQRPAKSSASAPPDEVLGAETASADATKPAPRRRASASAKAVQAAATARVDVPPEARHAMVAEAAYLRAERRGFAPGYDVDDWLAAESEVDSLLSAGPGAAQ